MSTYFTSNTSPVNSQISEGKKTKTMNIWPYTKIPYIFYFVLDIKSKNYKN